MTRLLLRFSVMFLLCSMILAGVMIAVGKTLPSGGQLVHGVFNVSTLYALDLNSGITLPLTREPVLPFSIVLSPDRTQLAFLVGYVMDMSHQLIVMNVDGTHARYMDGYFIARPQWLPDSTQLMIPNRYDTVKIINVFDRTANELLLPIAECHWFNLSPDGRHVMFYRYMETRGRCELHMIDVDGNNLQNLPYDAYPLWSADGRQLVIADHQGVSLIDLDDLDNIQTVFPNPAAYREFAWGLLQWSQDNTQLIFVEEQSLAVYTVPVYPEIGSPIRLDLTTQSNITPIWSPDGSEIAFLSTHTGSSEIYITNADGTNLRRVTYNDQFELNLLWLP